MHCKSYQSIYHSITNIILSQVILIQRQDQFLC